MVCESRRERDGEGGEGGMNEGEERLRKWGGLYSSLPVPLNPHPPPPAAVKVTIARSHE